jgi:hypothetical protein
VVINLKIHKSYTNFTPNKKGTLQALLQELEAQEEIRLEELLQSVKIQENFFQDLPSWEDQIAQIEQLSDQIEKDLEAYLNG